MGVWGRPASHKITSFLPTKVGRAKFIFRDLMWRVPFDF
nr:MAG TPA: hypothetical protein [Caudoviricetes sp.]